MDIRESESELQVKFLQAGRIYLRRLSHRDVGGEYLHMLSDPEVTKYLTVGKIPLSLSDLDTYVSSFDGNNNAVAFAIIETDGDRFMGTATLNAINWVSGTADVGMALSAQYRGDGHPDEVLSALIPYAFETLKLRRLYMGVLSLDEERIRSALSAGFVQEGVWRAHSLVDGRYEDEKWFGLIKE
jgi:ribosomal-protein-alanine N-acetyltransferase